MSTERVTITSEGGSKKVTVTTAGSREALDVVQRDADGNIIDPTGGLSGAGATGSVTLTNANQWYQLPDSGNVPSSKYLLIISAHEDFAGTMRMAFDNSSAPSATNGIIIGADVPVPIDLAGGQVVYIASDNAGDIVNYTTKII